MSKLDFTLSDADFDQARKIRAARLAAQEAGPALESFAHIRRVVDTAEANAAAASSSLFDLPNSIRDRRNRARERLRANLASIKSDGSQFFSESVAAAPGETYGKFAVAFDSAGSFADVKDTQTSIDLVIKPLRFSADNKADSAFDAAMQAFVSQSPQFKALADKPNAPPAGVCIKLSLRRDLTAFDIGGRIEVIKMMIPPLRDPNSPVQLETEFREEADGGKSLYVRIVVVKEFGPFSRNGDPIEQILKDITRKFARGSGGLDSVSPADLFRLFSFRFDLPSSIGDWLEQGRSWTSLLEGMRIATQIITRNTAAKLGLADLAAAFLTDRVSPKYLKGIAAAAAASINSSTETIVRLSPLELVFGQTVRDLGVAIRAYLRDKLVSGLDSDENVEAYLATTAVEDTLAAVVGDMLKIGANGKDAVNLARAALSALLNEKGPGPMEMLLPLKSMIESIDSVHALTHSAELKINIKGINNQLLRLVPDTAQQIVDSAKAFVLSYQIEPEAGTDTLDGWKANKDEEGKLDRSAYRKEPFCRGEFEKVAESQQPSLQGDTIQEILLYRPGYRGPPAFLAAQKPVPYSSATPGAKPVGVWDFELPKPFIVPVRLDGEELMRQAMQAARGGGGAFSSAPRRAVTGGAATAASGSRLPTDAELDAAFRACDSDGSGVLEKGEFLACVLQYFPTASPSKLIEAYNRYDKNRDGVVDQEEFKLFVKEACQ